jgi:hypothetical protein
MTLKITLTPRFVEVDGQLVRIWEGHSPKGAPCHVLVLGIAVPVGVDSSEFEEALVAGADPPFQAAGLIELPRHAGTIQ